jgi:hypothetical protein
MCRTVLLAVLVAALGGTASGVADAQTNLPARAAPMSREPRIDAIPAPSLACRQAVALVERQAGVPPSLMSAIARIESGRPDGRGGVHPWPWTINVEGEGHIYESKAAAIAAVQAFRSRGAKSIDVGCMQVNLMFHPDAFRSLDEAFDPMANARYAAKFLAELYAETHDWVRATALYHSATPALGSDYQRKVFAVLPDERRHGYAGGAGGNVWSTNVWSENVWNARGPAWPSGGGVPRPPALPPTGGYGLTNHAEAARLVTAPPGTVGRGLAAYRSAPIPLASRF